MFGGPIKVPPKPKRRGGNRETCGNYPGEYGQIAREPNTDYAAKSMAARARARELQQRERAAQRKEAHELLGLLRFETAADRRLQANRARAHLALALRAADRDLEARRQRLREMLRCEDNCMTKELVARAQYEPEQRLQRLRDEQERLKAEREAERQQQVEDLRMLQYRARCVDIRDMERKRVNTFINDARLYQMHEKKWLQQKAKEEDTFWEDVLRKNQEAMAAREEAEERATKARELELARSYLEQMEATGRAAKEERLRAQQEAAALYALSTKYEEAADEEGEGKRKKQAEQRAALDAQRAERFALHSALEEAERRFDLAQAIYSQQEAQREDTTLAVMKEKRRREVRMFLDYKHQEKRMVLEQERKQEEMLNSLAMRGNMERERRHQELEEQHIRMEQEAHRGLLEQLEERRTLAVAKAAEEAAEAERLEANRRENARLHEESVKSGHEKELRYQRDLIEQQAYQRTLKEREQCLERERLLAGRKEEAELDRRVRALFDQHFPPTPNAFRTAALAAPPPDMARPVPAPLKPPKPCSEEEALEALETLKTKGVAGAVEAAKAAAARERPPAGPASGVGPCDECGGYRVHQPCQPCSDPCASAMHEARRAVEATLHDKAGDLSLSKPWGVWLDQGKPFNGLGAASTAVTLPAVSANCHAPPAAPPLLLDPAACAELAVDRVGKSKPVKSTGRVGEVPPPPQCYMCR